MKFRNIFAASVAVLALAVSCQEEFEPTVLSELQVSSSYVGLEATGETNVTTIELTADRAWEIIVDEETQSWLTVSPTSGSAGTYTISFSAGAADETRNGTVYVQFDVDISGATTTKQQIINVIQMTEKAELAISTCAEVIAGAESVTYRVRGTVTRIVNTTYCHPCLRCDHHGHRGWRH